MIPTVTCPQCGGDGGFDDHRPAGLTKREHIAALAMQGLLASGASDTTPMGYIVDTAVAYTDALLERLAR